ncbi:hypothetical protein SCOCK_200009 [Actinacidiphila cocklensis]|uniref:Uncharacterized protein n=1 Tax=Actinacidiphila cocklensis TaxID=887465 RepID=A0A9W4DPN2_9ACTN|nr:hypothetical protein SCOCK_200009 [Actinacidiphila cocklensis]
MSADRHACEGNGSTGAFGADAMGKSGLGDAVGIPGGAVGRPLHRRQQVRVRNSVPWEGTPWQASVPSVSWPLWPRCPSQQCCSPAPPWPTTALSRVETRTRRW